MPLDIAEELGRLPTLGLPATGGAGAAASPLGIVSKQGRLLLRLGAATESLDSRYGTLAEQIAAQSERLTRAEDARLDAEASARQAALTTVQMMDALDWVYDRLVSSDLAETAQEVDAARRDCLRRMAGAGISEIPAQDVFDGRLHEGLEAVAAEGIPPYQIVRVVRRGFQIGPDVLRRAAVVTAL